MMAPNPIPKPDCPTPQEIFDAEEARRKSIRGEISSKNEQLSEVMRKIQHACGQGVRQTSITDDLSSYTIQELKSLGFYVECEEIHKYLRWYEISW